MGDDTMNAEFVRERITQLRLQKGVSEYKMSYDLGHSRGYINNISSGKSLPSMTEFFAICEYFDITAIEFFQGNVASPKLLRETIQDLEALNHEDLKLIQLNIKRLLKG
jgi:transcriptional regulator with XRE-family HTH domain